MSKAKNSGRAGRQSKQRNTASLMTHQREANAKRFEIKQIKLEQMEKSGRRKP